MELNEVLEVFKEKPFSVNEIVGCFQQLPEVGWNHAELYTPEAAAFWIQIANLVVKKIQITPPEQQVSMVAASLSTNLLAGIMLYHNRLNGAEDNELPIQEGEGEGTLPPENSPADLWG